MKWLLGILLPIAIYAAWQSVAWAVDTRIQQQMAPQIQQLRADVRNDARGDRIKFLEMKQNAGIITNDERIELNYLLKQGK